MTILVAFIIFWLILFVVSYVVVEYSQKYLYDETTPSVGLKLAGGTLLSAILMTALRKQTNLDTMFTNDIAWTVLQAIVWFGVFTLIYRFQPLHAFTLGVLTFLIVAGLASLAVDSLTGEVPPEARRELPKISKPLRRPASPTPLPQPPQEKSEPAKAAEK